MQQIALAGLCKIELPDETIRLCDGGRITWGSEVFMARNQTYGTIGALDSVGEGRADELPPIRMTLLPPSSTAAAVLVQPAHQGSRVRLWIAEYEIASQSVVGDPDLRFDGELDISTLDNQLNLQLTIIPAAGRLFELNIGNSLSPSFHKSVWPGETGQDNATGLGRPIAWGVQAPPSTVQSGGTASRNPYDRGNVAYA